MKSVVLSFIALAGLLSQNTPQNIDGNTSVAPSSIRSDGIIYAQKSEIAIGVLPFKGEGALEAENAPWKVIASDLDFSNKIEIVQLARLDTNALKLKGARMYVDGSYKIIGDSLITTANLKDFVTKKLLLTKTITVPKKDVRLAGHRFANNVVKTLFMQNGPFETSILVSRRVSGGKDIYVMDYDGYNMRKVASGSINMMPTFIDASRYVLVSYKQGRPELYRGNLNSSVSEKISYSKGMNISPDYSPTNGRLVFSSSRDGNSEIYTSDISGEKLERLTVSSANDGAPAWSPNGYMIAYISDRSGSPQLYVMDNTGSNERRLTFSGTYQDSPVWSPDGKKIAFTSRRDGKFDIFIIALDGSEETKITGVMGGHCEYPVWSPDGSQILFVHSTGGRNNIYRISADGAGEAVAVTKTGDVEMPAWSFMKE